MLTLTQWTGDTRFSEKPWLVIGEGPTFANVSDTPLEKYNTLALNNVVRELKVNVAHMLDITTLESCQAKLLENCDWLVMPNHPFVNGNPCEILALADWINYFPTLKELEERGRLVSYDLRFKNEPNLAGEIEIHDFSSEPAFELLANLGAKTIRSLGVDGGLSYHSRFESVERSADRQIDLLPFDLQFSKLEKIAQSHNIDYLSLVEPMLVFVGTDESQLLATRVLTYSIHKHASRPARVIPLVDVKVPQPKDEKNRPRTGFSFYRFAIPELAHYRGRALYVDSDMLVFSDLAELWNIEFGEQKILCTTQVLPEAWKDNSWAHPGRQFSVMLLDCQRLPWNATEIVQGLDEEKYSYAQLMFECCLVKPHEIEDRIPPGWNCLERFEPGETRLIHYTVIPTQPWLYDKNPFGDLWIDALKKAIAAGWISREFLEENLKKGYLRASLTHLIDLAKNKEASTPSHSTQTELSRVKELVAACQKANHTVTTAKNQIAQLRDELRTLQTAYKSNSNETNDLRRRLEAITEEFENKIRELEADRNNLYASTTWKLGRMITKPAALLKGK